MCIQYAVRTQRKKSLTMQKYANFTKSVSHLGMGTGYANLCNISVLLYVL